MREGEVLYITNNHPFMAEVLRMVDRAEAITSESPFYQTYLLARQRGFVKRVGVDGEAIIVSDRGKEFLEKK
ncbi:MAG: hypothetical protein H6773_00030 [Pseudomonadales bacterium]|nr:hypothetical protein [Pseudomonadales bacterium]